MPLQHDDQFRGPTPGPGPTEFPNQQFFVDRLGSDPAAVTGRGLRAREAAELGGRRGGATGEAFGIFGARDFWRLCRGEDVVSIGGSIWINLSGTQNLQTYDHLMVGGPKPNSCHLETKRDPYLKLQPLKVQDNWSALYCSQNSGRSRLSPSWSTPPQWCRSTTLFPTPRWSCSRCLQRRRKWWVCKKLENTSTNSYVHPNVLS